MASYTDIDNLDHAPELAEALGNMVVAWARAELILSNTLALVCGLNVNMALFGYYRIPTFEARVKFIRALITEWETTLDKEAIDRAIDKLAKLSATRNNWVHGAWAMDRKSPTKDTVVFNFRAAEGKGRRKPIKAHDVNHHADAVRSRTGALEALIPWDDIAP